MREALIVFYIICAYIYLSNMDYEDMQLAQQTLQIK